MAFTISRDALLGGEFRAGMIVDDYVCAIGLPSGGAIRASLGLASGFADIHRFMNFAREFLDLASVPDDVPPRIICRPTTASGRVCAPPAQQEAILCVPVEPVWLVGRNQQLRRSVPSPVQGVREREPVANGGASSSAQRPPAGVGRPPPAGRADTCLGA